MRSLIASCVFAGLAMIPASALAQHHHGGSGRGPGYYDRYRDYGWYDSRYDARYYPRTYGWTNPYYGGWPIPPVYSNQQYPAYSGYGSIYYRAPGSPW